MGNKEKIWVKYFASLYICVKLERNRNALGGLLVSYNAVIERENAYKFNFHCYSLTVRYIYNIISIFVLIINNREL